MAGLPSLSLWRADDAVPTVSNVNEGCMGDLVVDASNSAEN